MKQEDLRLSNSHIPEQEDGRGTVANKNKLPIDRGWAWVIVIATFFINLLNVGVYRSFGILFVEFLEEFNASKSVTSLIMGIYSASYSLTALLALNILVNKFSIRVICVLGGLMLCLSGILSYFAMSLEFLIFTHSFLTGTSSALLYGPGIVITGQYFQKRRALSQAIGSCGVSLGGMIVPQFIRFLLDEYGLRGTLLISGGLLSEIVVFALLYRPAPALPPEEQENPENLDLESFKKKIISQDEFEIISFESLDDSISQLNIRNDGVSNGHLDGDLVNGHHPKSNISVAKMIMQRKGTFRSRTESDPTRYFPAVDVFQTQSVPKDSFLSTNSVNVMPNSTSDAYSSDENQTLTLPTNSKPPYPRHRKDTSHRSLLDTLSQSSYLKYASNADIHMISTFSLNRPVVRLEDESTLPDKETSCFKKVAKFFDFSVFKLPHFYLIMGQSIFGVSAVSLYAAFLPAAAQEEGVSEVHAALLITVYAATDCVSRFLSGVIVETGKIKSHHLLATCMFMIGVLYQLTRFYTSFSHWMTYAAVFGLFSGTMPAMSPVVMIDFLGLDNFPKALGFVQVMNGVVLAAVTPLIGALRDVTGTYHLSYHLLGAFGMIAGTFLLMEPLARKVRDAKEVKDDHTRALKTRNVTVSLHHLTMTRTQQLDMNGAYVMLSVNGVYVTVNTHPPLSTNLSPPYRKNGIK